MPSIKWITLSCRFPNWTDEREKEEKREKSNNINKTNMHGQRSKEDECAKKMTNNKISVAVENEIRENDSGDVKRQRQ